MSHEQEARFDEILARALELPARERQLFIDAACGFDRELQADVERRLAARTADGAETVALACSALFGSTSRVNADSVEPQRPAIPDFEVVRRLGGGGFGEVWLARSLTGVMRAVKVLARSAKTQVELGGIRDYQVHARGHPHLLDVLHVGETPNHFYCVMELADAYVTAPTFEHATYEPRTLAAELERRGPLPVAEVVAAGRQVLAGLGHLHDSGLLHRDVKPANILFVGGRVKLADVGLVTRAKGSANEGCTPSYAPPEGVQDRSGDLYCLGKTLYELLTGLPAGRWPELPGGWDGENAGPVVALAEVIERACREDPQQRFASAGQMDAALAHVLDGSVVGGAALRASASPAAARRRPGRWLYVAGAGVFVLLLVISIRQESGVGRRGVTWPPSDICGVANPLVSSAVPPGARAPARALEIWFRQSPESPPTRLSEQHVPLRIGALTQIHAEWSEPHYTYVLLIDEHAQVSLIGPDQGYDYTQTRTRLAMPPGEDTWWPLKGDEGTVTAILLAAKKPVSDPPALVERIRALGPPPVADLRTLWLVTDGRLERLQRQARGIDPSRPVRVEPGLLEKLLPDLAGEFEHVEAMAFAQAAGVEPTEAP